MYFGEAGTIQECFALNFTQRGGNVERAKLGAIRKGAVAYFLHPFGNVCHLKTFALLEHIIGDHAETFGEFF